jgi:hypothetical protein
METLKNVALFVVVYQLVVAVVFTSVHFFYLRHRRWWWEFRKVSAEVQAFLCECQANNTN